MTDAVCCSFGSLNSRRLLKFDRDESVKRLGLLSVTPAGQIVFANASFEAMLGYEPGKLLHCLTEAACCLEVACW